FRRPYLHRHRWAATRIGFGVGVGVRGPDERRTGLTVVPWSTRTDADDPPGAVLVRQDLDLTGLTAEPHTGRHLDVRRVVPLGDEHRDRRAPSGAVGHLHVDQPRGDGRDRRARHTISRHNGSGQAEPASAPAREVDQVFSWWPAAGPHRGPWPPPSSARRRVVHRPRAVRASRGPAPPWSLQGAHLRSGASWPP